MCYLPPTCSATHDLIILVHNLIVHRHCIALPDPNTVINVQGSANNRELLLHDDQHTLTCGRCCRVTFAAKDVRNTLLLDHFVTKEGTIDLYISGVMKDSIPAKVRSDNPSHCY
jgi:hypothetical protein